MDREKHIQNKNLTGLAAAFYAVVMVAFPTVTEAGSKSAIAIWLNSVVPVLLPFFIFADFIKRTVDMERLPVKVYPFIMAFLSGYPMGAKIVGDSVKQGILSPEEGRHVLSYSLVTGPAFILGTIGAFLGNSRAAAMVALAHYMGAMLNGLIWRNSETGSSRGRVQDRGRVEKCRTTNTLDNFTDAILAGFRAMGIILAYLIVFMIGMELLDVLGVFRRIPGQQWAAFAKGMLEMTMGASALGMCSVNMKLKTVLTAFILSFGGLSVIGQSMSVSGGGWLSLTQLLKIKLTHGLLAGTITAVMVMFI